MSIFSNNHIFVHHGDDFMVEQGKIRKQKFPPTPLEVHSTVVLLLQWHPWRPIVQYSYNGTLGAQCASMDILSSVNSPIAK